MNLIETIQNKLRERGIAAYIIPTSDYHQSEYISDYFKVRSYLSGFTGSAGTLLITQNDARLWTDGRYFLQAEQQLEDSGITLMKMGDPKVRTIYDYLSDILKSYEDGTFLVSRELSRRLKDFEDSNRSGKFNA